VEADGKTVVLNSKETLESVKFAIAFWKDACDEGGFAWDDSGNNRAFLAGTISGHQQRRLDLCRSQEKAGYISDAGRQAAEGRHFPHAAAEGAGRPVQAGCAVCRHGQAYGKQQKAAKDFLRWFHSEKIYDQWSSPSRLLVGPDQDVEDHKLWKDDPINAAVPHRGGERPFCRYAGPANRNAAEVISKYIISDM